MASRSLFAALAFAFAFSASAAEEGAIDIATLKAAAAQDNTWALTELAARYEQGEDVPRDFAQANALYCRAARQGYAEAQFKLGWVYANGRGVPRDDGAAYRLIQMAAEQGHRHASELLEHVRRGGGTLPICMFPDPPAVAYVPPPVRPAPGAGVDPAMRASVERVVHSLAREYAIDPDLALAVIRVESNFNPIAVSPKNAMGLMQLIPETAQRFGVKQVFDMSDNVRGGLAYLRWLLALFRGNVQLVVAAYNAGEKAVEKYKGIPPYAQTQAYVRRIAQLYGKASHPYDPSVAEPSPLVAAKGRTKG